MTPDGDGKEDWLDRAMLWVNLGGFSLVAALLTAFVVLYGPKVLDLVLRLRRPDLGPFP